MELVPHLQDMNQERHGLPRGNCGCLGEMDMGQQVFQVHWVIYGITQYRPTLGHSWMETKPLIQQVQVLLYHIQFLITHTGSPASGVGGKGWPRARSQAMTWKVGDLVHMYGGFGVNSVGSSGYLNEMWSFNTTSIVWTFLGGICNLPS